ncbi:MAG TPA: magnesium/cobalt transporter CorA [Desulfobacteraceae bacterium]|nr:magnesium/cobalt transporter CorA [Desulfobacteraceae bacterium]HPJ67410.1 magnesium/cobalt transporter CorA [Desulfobacteraceae bacterium]
MAHFLKLSSKKAGLSPGTLVHVGERKIEKTRISIVDYDEIEFQEKEVNMVEECFTYKDKGTVTWINIDGLHDIDIIEKIGTHFDVHPLVLEDILHTGQRPKTDDLETYLYIVLKMLYYDEDEDEIKDEQFSLILGSNFVITFQERIGDIFNPVRDRIRSEKARIRKKNADYLAYALIDAVVDNYFVILERLGEKIEEMEEALLANPTPEMLQSIQGMKRTMISLRKSVWPLREVVSTLERTESSLIEESTNIYLRDVYDHTIQVIDTLESYRDMVSGMLDTYLSSLSNRMNEVMKVLTIIATIFIPLTFLAGIYGMNFESMPELKWAWAYPALWIIMIVLGLLMALYFHRKKWL